jgi:hypothetical protein
MNRRFTSDKRAQFFARPLRLVIDAEQFRRLVHGEPIVLTDAITRQEAHVILQDIGFLYMRDVIDEAAGV